MIPHECLDDKRYYLPTLSESGEITKLTRVDHCAVCGEVTDPEAITLEQAKRQVAELRCQKAQEQHKIACGDKWEEAQKIHEAIKRGEYKKIDAFCFFVPLIAYIIFESILIIRNPNNAELFVLTFFGGTIITCIMIISTHMTLQKISDIRDARRLTSLEIPSFPSDKWEDYLDQIKIEIE